MIYITGDTHGRFERIERFTLNMDTHKSDVMIILGDAGLNFYLNKSVSKATMRLDRRRFQPISKKSFMAVRCFMSRNIRMMYCPSADNCVISCQSQYGLSC